MATPRGRVIRVHDATWENARARARADGRGLAAVLNDFLEEYGATERERRAESRREPTS